MIHSSDLAHPKWRPIRWQTRPGWAVVLAVGLMALPEAASATRANTRLPVETRYVATTGSDTNAGSLDRPWRTLGHAVEAVGAGATIVLRAGVYRETVNVTTPSLTIRSYPGEVAELSGSDIVTGWIIDGTGWRKDGWTAEFARDGYFPLEYNPDSPLAGWPDMVFIDGNPLAQVATRGRLIAGTFYVDYRADRLYIGTNPTGRLVEASTRSRAVKFSAAGATLTGVVVRQYANTVKGLGAVLVTGPGATVDAIVVHDNAAIGVSFFGDNAVMRNSFVFRNGITGVHGHQINGFVAERNWLIANNHERFAGGSSEGGLKLTGARNVTWRGNVAAWNGGNGLWCDQGCDSIVAIGNALCFNARSGLVIEISNGGLAASNLSCWNGLNGLNLIESTNVEVWNNTFHANGRHLNIVEGGRSADVQSVTIRNNVFSDSLPGAVTFIEVTDTTHRRTAVEMGVTADYNAYYREAEGSPQWLSAWTDGSTKLRAATLADASSQTGQEMSSLYAEGGTNPFVANLSEGKFGLPPGSPATGAGLPLPAHVAGAIGWPNGGPVDIGLLRLG